MLNNKIQPSQFEDLISFIKQIMTRAASHLASWGAPKKYKMEGFHGRSVGQESKQKKRIVPGEAAF